MNKYKTIRLKEGKKGLVREGHPWIFRDQLQRTDINIRPGDIVDCQRGDGSFFARGYFNTHSEISFRALSFKEDAAIDQRFFTTRIKAALKKREDIFRITDAVRVVFSEADALPGLIIDLYKDTAVMQVLTLGMDRLKPYIIKSIRTAIKPKYIYEKSEGAYRKREGLKECYDWHGDKGKNIVEIFEGRARFIVDILHSHKTGFYLDQRRSRLALEPFVKDKRVLDLCCYTGGFSVVSALFGAREVMGVDVKDDWLQFARRNAALNGVEKVCLFTEGDLFAMLKECAANGERFDVIILDPPSFLKTKRDLESAVKGYYEINRMAMGIISAGGMLATFSCSHNMPNERFSDILKRAGQDAKRKIGILKRCHQAEDHPIVRGIPETEYLKGYFLRVE